jgi:hypothetical protein
MSVVALAPGSDLKLSDTILGICAFVEHSQFNLKQFVGDCPAAVLVLPCSTDPCIVEYPRRHFAFVLGCASYEHACHLPKASNDAVDIAYEFFSHDYFTNCIVNGTKAQIQSALQEFVAHLSPGCTVVVFFAGHAFEISGSTFLLPIDGHVDPDCTGAFSRPQLSCMSR